ncbi:MAG TPA: 3-deoxy-manno-octulosonate cytidylyltransferase [Steroidobacteraceae bacterium]|nr:3-deoxy-manno-octulosonate cytidylyltransferase [Steroidobacteraceae bacterium]
MTFKVCIPARLGSTRLPGKVLLDIGGRPMVQWVIEAALRSAADEVVVATDDERVATQALDKDGRNYAQLTRSDHPSGSDRIAEVATLRGWSADTIVVNVQGDEPLLPPVLIDQVAGLLQSHPQADIATLSTPIHSIDDFLDTNVVKVVRAWDHRALYFSRAPIPWHRSGAGADLQSQRSYDGAQRHLGIYAYRVAALQALTQILPTVLEQAEKLEQLRALESGMQIVVEQARAVPGPGVDTEHDLQRARTLLAGN